MSLISPRPHGASATRSNRFLRPLNPDLCKSSEHRVLTANKGDPNHEVTSRARKMAFLRGPPGVPGAAAAGTRDPARRQAGAAASRPVRGRSCRLKFLWTVNLGAGLGAVRRERKPFPRSPPEEPANPVHAPITPRRHASQVPIKTPGPARKQRRPRPTILRRAPRPGTQPAGTQTADLPAAGPQPADFPAAGRHSAPPPRKQAAKWSGFFSEQACCSSSAPASS